MTKRNSVKLSTVTLFLCLFCSTVLSTTWADREFVCPVCNTKNTFGVIASYGSYIYGWPSKYQFIFWPLTDEHVLYSCKQCSLSTLMWDFNKLPAEKLPAIKEALKTVEIKGKFKRYTEIPMSQRLEAAEKVYAVLDKDDEFWCQFRRVKGYHYAAENNQPKADEERKKALALATQMLDDKNNKVVRKELLLIAGAMKHFLGDDKGALADFATALKTKFEDKQLDAEKNANAEANLSAMLNEYVKRINSEQKPRLLKDQ